MKGSRILLVDMDRNARNSLVARLADEQCEIDRATTVAQARERLGARSYDAVLLNAYLIDFESGVSAIEAPKAVLANVPSHTVVVFYHGPMMKLRENVALKLPCQVGRNIPSFDVVSGEGDGELFEYLAKELTMAQTG